MKTRSNSKSSLDESKVVKYLLIGTAISFLMIMLVVPLITITPPINRVNFIN